MKCLNVLSARIYVRRKLKYQKMSQGGAPRAGPLQCYFWSQSKADLLHKHWQTMHHML